MKAEIEQCTVIHNENHNRFEVNLGNDQAVLIYSVKAGLFLLLHTEVPPAYEGKGIAGKMAKTALEYAEKEGFKVRSYCTYTTRYLERHAEYQHLEG